MIVHRDGENFLGLILPDDVVVEHPFDFGRFRQEEGRSITVGRLPRVFFRQKGRAEFDAFITDEERRAGLAGITTVGGRTLNEASDCALAFAAEGTLAVLFILRLAAFPEHVRSPAD